MPSITNISPPEVAAEIAELHLQLDAEIPRKILDQNIVIATWNLRAFGDLTEKWNSEPGDTPKRDLRDLRKIAEIISRFDVVALQEVRGNSYPEKDQFYDQIAWFMGNRGIPALSLRYCRGGTFDFLRVPLRSLGLLINQISWRISDHYPLWAEFQVND